MVLNSTALASRGIFVCLLSCIIFLSGGCATTQVNYGEPIDVVSTEINSAPDAVFNTICNFFQEQPKYEIENKNISSGIVTVRAKTGYPLRYVFIIDRSSTLKCSLIIRGLVGVAYRMKRQDIPESAFNEMKITMEEFIQEIKRRVK